MIRTSNRRRNPKVIQFTNQSKCHGSGCNSERCYTLRKKKSTIKSPLLPTRSPPFPHHVPSLCVDAEAARWTWIKPISDSTEMNHLCLFHWISLRNHAYKKGPPPTSALEALSITPFFRTRTLPKRKIPLPSGKPKQLRYKHIAGQRTRGRCRVAEDAGIQGWESI